MAASSPNFGHATVQGAAAGLPVQPSAVVEGAGRVWATFGEVPELQVRAGYPLCARGGRSETWMFPVLQSRRNEHGEPIAPAPTGDPRVMWSFDRGAGLWSAVRSLFDLSALPAPSPRGQATLVVAANQNLQQGAGAVYRSTNGREKAAGGPGAGQGVSVSALRAADSRYVLATVGVSHLAKHSRNWPIALGSCSYVEGPGDGGSLAGSALPEQGGGGGGVPRRIVWHTDSVAFFIGCGGQVTQRSWNGLRWVYMSFDLPRGAGEAVSLGRVEDALLAISSTGELFVFFMEPVSCSWETMLCHDGTPLQAWYHVRPPALLGRAAPATASGSSAATGSIFFVSRSGEVYELIGLRRPQWRQHKRPQGVIVAALAGAGTATAGSLFAVSTAGDLYEYSWEGGVLLPSRWVVRVPSVAGDEFAPWMLHSRPEDVEGIAQEPATVLSTDLVAHLLGDSVLRITSGSFALLLRSTSGRIVARLPSDAHGAWVWTSVWAPNDLELKTELAVLVGSMEIFVFDWENLLSADFRDRRAQPHTMALIAPNLAGGLLEIVAGERSWHFKVHKPPSVSVPSAGNDALVAPVAIAVNPHRSQRDSQTFAGVPDAMVLLADCRVADLNFWSGPPSESEPGRSQGPGNGEAVNGVKYTIHSSIEDDGGDAPFCDFEAGPNNCEHGTPIPEGCEPRALQPPPREAREAVANRTVPVSLLAGPAPARPPVERLRAVSTGQSLLMVSKSGSLFEYFWNGATWVWLRHSIAGGDAVGATKAHGSSWNKALSGGLAGVASAGNGFVLALTRKSRMLKRERRRTDAQLTWRSAALPPPVRIASAAPMDLGEGFGRRALPLFFISTKGHLMVMRMSGELHGGVVWDDIGMPHGGAHGGSARAMAIADANVLRRSRAFVVCEFGRLWTVSAADGNWRRLPRLPGKDVLSAQTGAVSRPSLNSPFGEVILRGEAGGLFAAVWSGEDQDWVWEDLGRPPAVGGAAETIASAPCGALLEGSAVFAVSATHRVWELRRVPADALPGEKGTGALAGASGRWRWVDHGRLAEHAGKAGASLEISSVSPKALGDDRVAFLTTAGHVVILACKYSAHAAPEWVWMIVDTPEAPPLGDPVRLGIVFVSAARCAPGSGPLSCIAAGAEIDAAAVTDAVVAAEAQKPDKARDERLDVGGMIFRDHADLLESVGATLAEAKTGAAECVVDASAR